MVQGWRGRGRWCVAAWTVVVLAALLALSAGFGRLGAITLSVPGSSSARAASLVARGMPQLGTEQLVLAFDSRTLRVTDGTYQDAVSEVAQALPRLPGAGQVLPLPGAPGHNPHHDYFLVGMTGDVDARRQLMTKLRTVARESVARASQGRVTLAVTGPTPVLDETVSGDLRDLRLVETLTAPLAFGILVAGLGSLGAALVPLLVAGLSVLVSTGALAALSQVTHVDTLSVVVATTVGFGLGLDYGLLLWLRHRHYRDRLLDPVEAAARASASAGRTVLWCGGAVVLAGAALQTVPLDAVRSAGLAAMLATVVTTAVATTLLPTLLPRLDPLFSFARIARRRRTGSRERVSRWANHLMAHPWPYLLAAVAVLGLAAAPAGGLRLGVQVDRAAIAGTEAGRGLEQAEADGLAGFRLLALPHTAGAGPVDTTGLTDALSADRRVTMAAALDNGRDLTVVAVTDSVRSDRPAADELMADVRAMATRTLPPGQTVYVAGPGAEMADARAVLLSCLGQVAALIVAGSFLLMASAFRSLLLPLKALAMNALSLAASFGLLAWATAHTADTVNIAIPLLAFTIVFGLSMDYEVFLVHRITEHYRADRDHRRAVAQGLSETARPVTLAAATMACVFAALMATHRQEYRQFGFLVAGAVLLDATVIRLVLVPALMRLLGHRNWWLPKPVERLLSRPPSSASANANANANANDCVLTSPSPYEHGKQ
ncbi:MMPL family transporter [Streptomyces monashensis]|uniref:MMPL family transporter n=1 Tax=Streptomyces monashensis TaxID=1678012 RepID=UPI0033ED7CC9